MHHSILKALDSDILIDMIKAAEQAEQWNKMLYIANILCNYTQHIYEERQYCKATGKRIPFIKIDHPLVYYFGISEQMRGIAYLNLGDYDQARNSIYRYAELGWVEDLGEEGQVIAHNFRLLAKVNLYAVEILTGKTELLNDYVRVLQSFPQEVLDGLAVILQAALRYGINVDKHLDCMKKELNRIDLSQTNEIVQSKYQRLYDLMNLYNSMKPRYPPVS